MYKRTIYKSLHRRLDEPRRFIQVLLGPRQTGKTTLAHQIMREQSQLSFEEVKGDSNFWDRLIESAIGAAVANGLKGTQGELYYWSSRNKEVDFILRRGDVLVAIEVKSGRKRSTTPGIEAFAGEFSVKRKLLVGSQGIPVEEFLLIPPEEWLN